MSKTPHLDGTRQATETLPAKDEAGEVAAITGTAVSSHYESL